MPTTSRHKHKIYFAYGTNMHLKQMVKRCPNTRYLGVAKLPGYRWQINVRGYTNIVEASAETRESPTTVQGLCYLIGAEDELKLDRVEGVPTAYQKRVLRVELVLAKSSLVGRDVSEIASFSSEELKAGSGRGEAEVVEALAYVSKDYIEDGPPKGEYVARMRLGLRDALELGMSKEYARVIERVVAVGMRGAGASAGTSAGTVQVQVQVQVVWTDLQLHLHDHDQIEQLLLERVLLRPRRQPAITISPLAVICNSHRWRTDVPAARSSQRAFSPGIDGISTRGVANIVATTTQDGNDSVVQGILFTVTPKDVKTLDKKEGIAKGYYEKIVLRVKVEPLAISGLKSVKTVVAAVKLASNSQAEAREPRKHRHGQDQHGQRADVAGVREVEALVYLSSQYKKDGHLRAEYVGRMQLAMADALKLGVDEAYLRASLHPSVLGVDEGAVSAHGKRDIIVRQPAGDASGAAQTSGSPKDRRIIERVPAGTGYQAAA